MEYVIASAITLYVIWLSYFFIDLREKQCELDDLELFSGLFLGINVVGFALGFVFFCVWLMN